MNWKGRKVVITAGPTREHLDPVRFFTNGSTGKMGYALAREARRRGGDVVLVSGPTQLKSPAGVRMRPVVTAEQMYRAALSEFDQADVLIAAAAVGDWKPQRYSPLKIKKTGRPLRLSFVATVDILAALSTRRGKRMPRPYLVGFALETHDWIANGFRKLKRKGADMIVANRHTAMGSPHTRIALLKPAGIVRRYPPMSKRAAAVLIIGAIGEVLDA